MNIAYNEMLHSRMLNFLPVLQSARQNLASVIFWHDCCQSECETETLLIDQGYLLVVKQW